METLEEEDPPLEGIALELEEAMAMQASSSRSTLGASNVQTSAMRRTDRKREYAFAPRNDVISATNPPGPCFVCGSEKHWRRECPHRATWEAAQKTGKLKKAYTHVINKDYEEQEDKYLLDLAEAQMAEADSDSPF